MNTVALSGDQVGHLQIGERKFQANIVSPSREAISTVNPRDTFEPATPTSSAVAVSRNTSVDHFHNIRRSAFTRRVWQPLANALRPLVKRLKQRRFLVPILSMCAVTTIVAVAAVFAGSLGPAGVILLTLTVPFALTAWQLWHNAHEEKRRAKKEAQREPKTTPVIIQLHHLPEVPESKNLPEEFRLGLRRAVSVS